MRNHPAIWAVAAFVVLGWSGSVKAAVSSEGVAGRNLVGSSEIASGKNPGNDRQESSRSVPRAAEAANLGDAEKYAARERNAAGVEKFQGGDASIYIGGSALTVVLIVLLLIIIL